MKTPSSNQVMYLIAFLTALDFAGLVFSAFNDMPWLVIFWTIAFGAGMHFLGILYGERSVLHRFRR